MGLREEAFNCIFTAGDNLIDFHADIVGFRIRDRSTEMAAFPRRHRLHYKCNSGTDSVKVEQIVRGIRSLASGELHSPHHHRNLVYCGLPHNPTNSDDRVVGVHCKFGYILDLL